MALDDESRWYSGVDLGVAAVDVEDTTACVATEVMVVTVMRRLVSRWFSGQLD